MLDVLYQDLYKTPEIKKSNLEDLAARLSDVTHKEPPWGWKYLHSLLRGHKNVKISAELDRAIVALGAVVDGQHILLARAHPIQTYSINGNVERNSIIFHQSRRCAKPDCQLPFVPNHPRRKYCQVCSPPRGK